MQLKAKNFKFEHSSNGPFFDVYERKDEDSEYKILAYGVPFKDILFNIAWKHINERDETYTLDQLNNELVKEINNLKTQFND